MSGYRRAVLSALSANPISVTTLADELGIGPARIHEHIDALRAAGFSIEERPSGYVVTDAPEFGGLALEYGLESPFSIEYHESIGSTNDRARELAEAGHREVVVIAEVQTRGRGRLDREWTSPPGGIWMSVVLSPDLPAGQTPVLTLAAAVAVARAVADTGAAAGLKWPNDVLIKDTEAKLAGILTEAAGDGGWVVLGVGVNANIDGDALPSGATSLREEVGDVNRRRLIHRFLRELTELRDTPMKVLDAWRDRSLTLGRKVRVTTSGEVIEGTAVDVSMPGTLLIDSDEGRVSVDAGDCEHLRPV